MQFPGAQEWKWKSLNRKQRFLYLASRYSESESNLDNEFHHRQ